MSECLPRSYTREKTQRAYARVEAGGEKHSPTLTTLTFVGAGDATALLTHADNDTNTFDVRTTQDASGSQYGSLTSEYQSHEEALDPFTQEIDNVQQRNQSDRLTL